MARVCDITGKKLCFGNNVSHANNKTKRVFLPNIIKKFFFVPEKGVWIDLRVANSTYRTIKKNGILAVLKKYSQKGTISESKKKEVEAVVLL